MSGKNEDLPPSYGESIDPLHSCNTSFEPIPQHIVGKVYKCDDVIEKKLYMWLYKLRISYV